MKYVKINKEVWIPAIKKNIASWEEFAQSIFCKKREDKKSALECAEDLRNFLALVESDTLTQKDCDYYFNRYIF